MSGFDLWAILSNADYVSMLLHGIQMTFIIYAGSWLLAMSLAVVLLAIRLSPFRFGDPLVAAYVSYHRNVPTLVQLMLWYFGIFTLLPSDWGTGCRATTRNRSSPSSALASVRRPISARICARACVPSIPARWKRHARLVTAMSRRCVSSSCRRAFAMHCHR